MLLGHSEKFTLHLNLGPNWATRQMMDDYLLVKFHFIVSQSYVMFLKINITVYPQNMPKSWVPVSVVSKLLYFTFLVCLQNPYVNLRRKIPTLNEGTVKRWIADVGTKQWQNTKRYASCVCLLCSPLKLYPPPPARLFAQHNTQM